MERLPPHLPQLKGYNHKSKIKGDRCTFEIQKSQNKNQKTKQNKTIEGMQLLLYNRNKGRDMQQGLQILLPVVGVWIKSISFKI